MAVSGTSSTFQAIYQGTQECDDGDISDTDDHSCEAFKATVTTYLEKAKLLTLTKRQQTKEKIGLANKVWDTIGAFHDGVVDTLVSIGVLPETAHGELGDTALCNMANIEDCMERLKLLKPQLVSLMQIYTSKSDQNDCELFLKQIEETISKLSDKQEDLQQKRPLEDEVVIDRNCFTCIKLLEERLKEIESILPPEEGLQQLLNLKNYPLKDIEAREAVALCYWNLATSFSDEVDDLLGEQWKSRPCRSFKQSDRMHQAESKLIGATLCLEHAKGHYSSDEYKEGCAEQLKLFNSELVLLRNKQSSFHAKQLKLQGKTKPLAQVKKEPKPILIVSVHEEKPKVSTVVYPVKKGVKREYQDGYTQKAYKKSKSLSPIVAKSEVDGGKSLSPVAVKPEVDGELKAKYPGMSEELNLHELKDQRLVFRELERQNSTSRSVVESLTGGAMSEEVFKGKLQKMRKQTDDRSTRVLKTLERKLEPLDVYHSEEVLEIACQLVDDIAGDAQNFYHKSSILLHENAEMKEQIEALKNSPESTSGDTVKQILKLEKKCITNEGIMKRYKEEAGRRLDIALICIRHCDDAEQETQDSVVHRKHQQIANIRKNFAFAMANDVIELSDYDFFEPLDLAECYANFEKAQPRKIPYRIRRVDAKEHKTEKERKLVLDYINKATLNDFNEHLKVEREKRTVNRGKVRSLWADSKSEKIIPELLSDKPGGKTDDLSDPLEEVFQPIPFDATDFSPKANRKTPPETIKRHIQLRESYQQKVDAEVIKEKSES
ncbi:hypothetical protein JQC92_07525 [Shewanella sp. 202IG2-18]|uniref:hypothetical protein n=1 Tax=Parashewanella hymeniacidonis TaxID=2807618 RepID=UPI001960C64A|nr:hypothetical protein [Parashewanella hymeniacidonis]MBM7071891.1 hypothetical protein [Parashewanella hymeniacidonis]